jgi:hypothetical protein
MVTLALYGQTFNVSTTSELRDALQKSAQNGEDDTIILADGRYKISDDDKGTFKFLDNENYKLTLKGSSSENVILDGEEKSQILRVESSESMILSINGLTFVNGKYSSSGGGLYTNCTVEVRDCNFSNNQTAGNYGGGGFYAHTARVEDSVFENNKVISADSAQGGGGFYAEILLSPLKNSKFIKNSISTSYYRSDGAGFWASTRGESIIITDSLFDANSISTSASESKGAGFYLDGTVKLKNSIVKNNTISSKSSYGGGFYISSNADIENVQILNNHANELGGGFYAYNAILRDSKVIDNSAIGLNYNGDPEGEGGGFFVQSDTIVLNSIIKHNRADIGAGAFESSSAKVINTQVLNNSSSKGAGAIKVHDIYMTNSVLAKNSSGLELAGYLSEKSFIVNSVFVDKNDSIIFPQDGYKDSSVVTLKNNYIDLSMVTNNNLAKNNIYKDVKLGFADVDAEDFNITSSSSLIDAGTDEFKDIFVVDKVNYFTQDYAKNTRKSGAKVDIGIYEYTTTKPTINSITYSGTTQEYRDVTFKVDYNLSKDRTIGSVEYDYNDDGTFVVSDTHKFEDAKTYKVNVKVTDSSGEFSVASTRVIIAELPYSKMSYEEKLKETIDEQHYKDMVDLIDKKIVSAKTYVLEHPSEFSLVKKTDVEFTSKSIDALVSGWTLTSTPFEIRDLSVFDGVKSVWVYDGSKWSAYSSDSEISKKIISSSEVDTLKVIPAKSGIWIQK